MLWRWRRQRVSNSPSSSSVSSTNSVVIGEGTEQLAGDNNKMELKLFCWIFGDQQPFSVKISPDETVDDLKEAIVTKNPNRLQGIDAVSLRLWKKEIKNTKEEKDGLQPSDLDDGDELDTTYKVGRYFGYGYTPPEMKIHIIIKAPEIESK
jgi:Crinkler effector protein N-terminal domain